MQTDAFAVLFINQLKNLTNVVIGKLGKLVHKQNCSHHFCFILSLLYIRYITIETKEVARIGYTWFLFPYSYSGEGIESFVSIVMYLIHKP
jgi:hypothetical protein